MHTALLRVAVAAVSCSLLVACGTTAARTGFIPLNVPMMKDKDNDETQQFKAKGFALNQFGKVQVEPIEAGGIQELRDNPTEMESMRGKFQAGLQKALESTGGGGQRVLVVRGAITAFKPNRPVLNVAPQTQLMKRGYGYAACEIYATDAATGQVVAAWMNTQDTQRFGTEKLSQFGTIEKACESWGPEFRKFLSN